MRRHYLFLEYVWLLPIALCVGVGIILVSLKVAALIRGKRKTNQSRLVSQIT
jgi:hypothetical protein